MAEDTERDEAVEVDEDAQKTKNQGVSGFFRRFKKQFWIINSLELIERGAYYSLMAILAQHMVQNLHFTATITGIVAALFMFCLYFLPVILGAIADKVGFRQMLILNFILMFIGYIMFGLVNDTVLFILAIIILGVGAGGFKPIISSSIAHITPPNQRNLAFSIYYWMINCGAFVFPLTWGLYFAQFDAIAAAQYFQYVFLFSAFFVIINMIITFIFYKNPKEPESEKKIKTVFVNAGMVVKDIKFFSLLVIYSGFWFMFAMNHTFLPLYMLNFQIMPGWFTPLLLATINPGTIIVLGPYLSRYADRYPSLQLMIIGIIIFMSGLIIIAFVPTPIGLFTGIVVFSTGEFLTHPSFISYTSKIAPKDKVTIYMGYIFIATGIGLVLGSLFGGIMYDNIAQNMASPTLFWGIVVSIGLVSTFFFIYYNRKYAEEKPSEEEELIEEKVRIPKKKGILDMNLTMIMPLIAIPILLFIAQSAGTQTFHELSYEEDIDEGIDWARYDKLAVSLDSISGTTSENSNTDETFEIPRRNIISATFVLTWTDEPTSYTQGTNAPDEFSISVVPPNGTEETSEISTSGQISFTVDIDTWRTMKKEYTNDTGQYEVSINCHNCGDDSAFFPLLGLRTTQDTGNDWQLAVSYEYYRKPVG
jgi:MFS family permease